MITFGIGGLTSDNQMQSVASFKVQTKALCIDIVFGKITNITPELLRLYVLNPEVYFLLLKFSNKPLHCCLYFFPSRRISAETISDPKTPLAIQFQLSAHLQNQNFPPFQEWNNQLRVVFSVDSLLGSVPRPLPASSARDSPLEK